MRSGFGGWHLFAVRQLFQPRSHAVVWDDATGGDISLGFGVEAGFGVWVWQKVEDGTGFVDGHGDFVVLPGMGRRWKKTRCP